MSAITVFFNTFTDINYAAPLLVEAAAREKKYQLLFYFTDLKRPSKVFFKKYQEIILNLPAVRLHEVVICNSLLQLKRFLHAQRGVLLATTPSLYQLQRLRLLPRAWWRPRLRLIGMDYFGEYTHIIAPALHGLILSTPFWDNNYRVAHRHYGLPYWDLFSKPSAESLPSEIKLAVDERFIVIPEIMQDGDTWFHDCREYLTNHAQRDVTYVLKYRLKTLAELSRNKALERELPSQLRVQTVYSPLYTATVPLLQRAEYVVFTSNASLISMDCMAAQSHVELAYTSPRYGIWAPWMDQACADALSAYQAHAAATIKKFIGEPGDFSMRCLNFIEQIIE